MTTPHATRDPLDRPVVSPRVDVFESDADILLLADVPGAAEGGVRLTWERGQLTLEAPSELGEAPGTLLAAEFGDVLYRRSFVLPKGIDADAISAELSSGVLRIRLPKLPAAQPRRIKVEATA